MLSLYLDWCRHLLFIARCGVCIKTGFVIYDLVNDVESVFRLVSSFIIFCTLWSLFLDCCCRLLLSAQC